MLRFHFQDRTLVCQDCKREFTWAAGEQEFYAVMGFDNDPKRCPDCRQDRRFAARKLPVQHQTVCDHCGRPTTVPFIPRLGRPVYCRHCYEQLMGVPESA